MYAIVAGGGKVGTGVLRRMLRLGHEATLVEQRRDRFERLEEEFEHQVLHGDATELYVLEQAGIERPPDLVHRGHRRRRGQHRHRPGRARALRRPRR